MRALGVRGNGRFHVAIDAARPPLDSHEIGLPDMARALWALVLLAAVTHAIDAPAPKQTDGGDNVRSMPTLLPHRRPRARRAHTHVPRITLHPLHCTRSCHTRQRWSVPVGEVEPERAQQQRDADYEYPDFLQTGEGVTADGEVCAHTRLSVGMRGEGHAPTPRVPRCADARAPVHVREDEVHVPEEVRVHCAHHMSEGDDAAAQSTRHARAALSGTRTAVPKTDPDAQLDARPPYLRAEEPGLAQRGPALRLRADAGQRTTDRSARLPALRALA